MKTLMRFALACIVLTAPGPKIHGQGGDALAPVHSEINPKFPLANFGSVAMQHFIITFDQENHLVRLEGPRKRITLGVTPAPLRLVNQPGNPTDPSLAPVG